MTDPTVDNAEIRRLQRLLDDIHSIAEHASMTGACADGLPAALARYNAVLRRLEEMGAVAAGMFEPLPDSAGFGQLCIEARLLSGYLRGAAHEARHGREDDKAPSTSPDVCTIIALAPFMDRKDLTELAKNALSSCGCVDAGVLVGLAPFMEHGEIGRIAREHMKGWFRASQPEPPSPTEAPAPPEPPDAKDEPEPVDAKAGPGPCCPSGVGERVKDVAERLRSVADRLARAEDPDERLALARELGELAREQTETARKAQA